MILQRWLGSERREPSKIINCKIILSIHYICILILLKKMCLNVFDIIDVDFQKKCESTRKYKSKYFSLLYTNKEKLK